MTTLQKAEEKVYTGFEAMQLMDEGISVAQEDKQHVEFFKGENGAVKGKNHETGFVGELSAKLGEFMSKKFVKFVEKLKVGDYVKVAGGANGFSNMGDILQLDSATGADFYTKRLDGEYGGFKYTYNLVRATAEEVQEAQQARLVAGDFAKVISNAATTKQVGRHEFSIGEIVKLDERRTSDGFKASHLDGHDWWNVMREDLMPLTAEEVAEMEQKEKDRKAEEAAKKLREQQEALEAGEFARIIGNECSHRFPMGEIVKLTRVEADRFRADYVDGHDFWYVKRTDLAPVTKEETKKAMLKTVKRGDYLKVNVRGFNTNVKVGDLVKVRRNDNSRIPFEIESLEGKDLGWILANEVEKATAAEVKEFKTKLEEERKEKELREKWEAVGRKVGEYKVGDIVRVTGTCGGVNRVGDIGEVTGLRGESLQVNAGRGTSVNWCVGELVVTVEQRFDAQG